MSKKKILLILIATIVLGASLGAGVYLVGQNQQIAPKAAPATTLTLIPSSPTVTLGDTVTVNVAIDTGENSISGAEVYLEYDSGAIVAESISAGSFFTEPGAVNEVVTSDTASITLFPPPTNPKQGSGTLVTVVFRAAAVGSSGIRVDVRTIVGAQDEGVVRNVLVGTVPTTITVEASAGGGPTSTPPPTFTPTPTPTSSGGDLEPTLTPTPTSTTGGGAGTGGGAAITATPTLPDELPVAGVVSATLSILGAGFSVLLLGILLL